MTRKFVYILVINKQKMSISKVLYFASFKIQINDAPHHVTKFLLVIHAHIH